MKKNILMIIVEDFGRHLEDIPEKSKFINNLIKSGLTFNNVFTTGSTCSVSRSSIMTGHYPHTINSQNHRYGNKHPLPEGIKSLPKILKDNGYATAIVGKQDVNYVEDADWDIIPPVGPAVHRDLPESKPFFVMYNLGLTHEFALIKESDPVDNQPFYDYYIKNIIERKKKFVNNINVDEIRIPPYIPDCLTEYLQEHYMLLSYEDHSVKAIVEALLMDGKYKDTIIILLSDHGRPFPRCKREVYDSGTQIWLTIFDESSNFHNMRCDNLVSSVDIAPSILKYVGIDVPDYLENYDIFDTSISRKYVFSSKDRVQEYVTKVRAIRSKDHKLIWNAQENIVMNKDGNVTLMPTYIKTLEAYQNSKLTEIQDDYLFKPRPEWEFYDLKSDPDEINNLIDKEEYYAIIEEMKSELFKHIQKTEKKDSE